MTFAYDNVIGTGTDQELLDFTRAAIAQITVMGQNYTTEDGRTLTRADLPTLHKQVAWLEARIDADAGQSTENVARMKRAT